VLPTGTALRLLCEEAAAGQIAHEGLVDRRALELEVVEVLASGSLAMVSWYLIERACFSLISAASKSPMMRWGSWWRLTATAMSGIRIL
jgi:hypothetical protein